MVLTMASVTRCGAFVPGIKTPPISRSALLMNQSNRLRNCVPEQCKRIEIKNAIMDDHRYTMLESIVRGTEQVMPIVPNVGTNPYSKRTWERVIRDWRDTLSIMYRESGITERLSWQTLTRELTVFSNSSEEQLLGTVEKYIHAQAKESINERAYLDFIDTAGTTSTAQLVADALSNVFPKGFLIESETATRSGVGYALRPFSSTTVLVASLPEDVL